MKKFIALLVALTFLSGCQLTKNEKTALMIGGAIAAGVGVYALCKNGGCSGSSGYSSNLNSNREAQALAASMGKDPNAYHDVLYGFQYDWDQFYNQYYRLVWRCRNVSNGQFAPDFKCAGKSKTDFRWPRK